MFPCSINIDDPVTYSTAMVAFVAVLPLLTTFVLLGGLRWSPLAASVCSLIVATVVALRGYGIRLSVTINCAICCVTFSMLSVTFIIKNAIRFAEEHLEQTCKVQMTFTA